VRQDSPQDAPITGRRDDMLIDKGRELPLKQIEQMLIGIPGIGNNYQIIVEEVDGVNNVRVNVEAGPGVTGYLVEKALKETLGFSPKGDVFPLGGLPRQAGKAKRAFHEKIGGGNRESTFIFPWNLHAKQLV
jgi:phenylacetate-CoA ligase